MLATEKILKLLLENPKKEWKQAELAKEAGCSKAFISKLVRSWLQKGLVARPKPRSILLISFAKALSAWSAVRRLPRPIYIKTNLGKEKIEQILKKEQGYALTLFSAAWHRVKLMRTNTVEFYTTKNKINYFVKKLGTISRGQTPVMVFAVDKEFLKSVEKIEGLWLVSWVQCYVDLIAMGGTATRVAHALAHKYFE